LGRCRKAGLPGCLRVPSLYIRVRSWTCMLQSAGRATIARHQHSCRVYPGCWGPRQQFLVHTTAGITRIHPIHSLFSCHAISFRWSSSPGPRWQRVEGGLLRDLDSVINKSAGHFHQHHDIIQARKRKERLAHTVSRFTTRNLQSKPRNPCYSQPLSNFQLLENVSLWSRPPDDVFDPSMQFC
jgi:hypothetical protein